MREIKFDAIYKPTGEHFEPKRIDFTDNTVWGDFDGETDDYCYFSLGGNYGDAIIRQWTGLKDKHGKEIYEGDIVHLQILSEPYTIQGNGWMDVDETEEVDIKGPIVFKYSMFGIKTSERGVFPLDDPEFIDVIGNIYEHTYLLKDDPS